MFIETRSNVSFVKNDVAARAIALSIAPSILRAAFLNLPSVLIAVNYRADATNV